MTRAIVFFLVLVFVGLFALINWTVFSAQTSCRSDSPKCRRRLG